MANHQVPQTGGDGGAVLILGLGADFDEIHRPLVTHGLDGARGEKLRTCFDRLVKGKVLLAVDQLGKIDLQIGTSQGEPDLNHHKNAGAPNLIHSLDSSLLQLALVDFPYSFTCIHDSVLAGVNHIDELNTALRAAYTKLFTEHSPLHDFADAIGSTVKPPMVYDFDPAVVQDSPYFFC